MISLTNPDGSSISSFGQGNSAYAQGAPVNAAQFGGGGLFSHISNAAGTRGAPTGALAAPKLIDPSSRTSTTTNMITSTLGQVGSAQRMGYQNPAKEARGGARGSAMAAPSAPVAGDRQLLSGEPVANAMKPLKTVASRAGSMLQGVGEGRPGGGLPEAAGGGAEAGEAAGAGELGDLAVAAL